MSGSGPRCERENRVALLALREAERVRPRVQERVDRLLFASSDRGGERRLRAERARERQLQLLREVRGAATAVAMPRLSLVAFRRTLCTPEWSP